MGAILPFCMPSSSTPGGYTEAPTVSRQDTTDLVGPDEIRESYFGMAGTAIDSLGFFLWGSPPPELLAEWKTVQLHRKMVIAMCLISMSDKELGEAEENFIIDWAAAWCPHVDVPSAIQEAHAKEEIRESWLQDLVVNMHASLKEIEEKLDLDQRWQGLTKVFPLAILQESIIAAAQDGLARVELESVYQLGAALSVSEEHCKALVDITRTEQNLLSFISWLDSTMLTPPYDMIMEARHFAETTILDESELERPRSPTVSNNLYGIVGGWTFVACTLNKLGTVRSDRWKKYVLDSDIGCSFWGIVSIIVSAFGPMTEKQKVNILWLAEKSWNCDPTKVLPERRIFEEHVDSLSKWKENVIDDLGETEEDSKWHEFVNRIELEIVKCCVAVFLRSNLGQMTPESKRRCGVGAKRLGLNEEYADVIIMIVEWEKRVCMEFLNIFLPAYSRYVPKFLLPK